jgi:hypothetical protein
MAGRTAVVGVSRIVRHSVVAPVLLALLVVVAADGPAIAQQPDGTTGPEAEAAAAPAPVNVDELPISVDRIQQGLEREPVLNLVPSQPVFRVEVIQIRPRWFDTEIDWTDGRRGMPVPTVPQWHSQFLSMVTPPQALPFGAFTGVDLLQVMATSLAQALATKGVAKGVSEAMRERREEDARREVDEAIDRWMRERGTPGQQEAPRDPP